MSKRRKEHKSPGVVSSGRVRENSADWKTSSIKIPREIPGVFTG
jgi:hypothetical protein